MRYALMIHVDPAGWADLSEEQGQAVSQEYLDLRMDPRVVDGAELAPVETASTVRVHAGDLVVTDGPFADTKEVLGGYYIIDADDLDAAIDFAGRIPAARMGGAVEVWPLVARNDM